MSNSREVLEGPLDVVKEYIGIVARHDAVLANDGFGYGDEDRDEIISAVALASSRLPILHQEVVVIGRATEPAPLFINDETRDGSTEMVAMPEKFMRFKNPTGSDEEVRGLLRGFTLERVVDDEGEIRPRILYLLETQRETFEDLSYRCINIATYNWACVSGSGVLPVEPINAHSFGDLAGDEGIAIIDRILEREQPVEDVRIQTIAEYLNKILSSDRQNMYMHHQRVSYLNSTGILAGKKIITSDFILGSPPAGSDHTAQELSESSTAYRFVASNFTLLRGYTRVRNEPVEATVNEEFELYARGKSQDGQSVTIPMKSVIEVC